MWAGSDLCNRLRQSYPDLNPQLVSERGKSQMIETEVLPHNSDIVVRKEPEAIPTEFSLRAAPKLTLLPTLPSNVRHS